MPYGVLQHRALDAAGNLITGTDVRVRLESAALPLVQLYADSAGQTTIGNPTTAGYFADGKIRCYVAHAGLYRVDVLKNGEILDTFQDVEVGLNLGEEGQFIFDDSDLSSTLVTATVTSTAVNSGTETVTKTGHNMITGQVGFVTTSVNGLTANTQKYYVIRVDNDNFKLATSYANAMAGTPFDLTGTTNFTFKRLLDPMEAVYVIPDGNAIDGSDGALVRVLDGAVWPEWFGAARDGATDDREALMAAIEFASFADVTVRLRKGTYAFDPGTDAMTELFVYRQVNIEGAGIDRTYLKNLSAAGNGVNVVRTSATTPASGIKADKTAIGGFTVDQNESTGRGFYCGAGHSRMRDIRVTGQDGETSAVKIEGATLCTVDHLIIDDCDTGLELTTLGYGVLTQVHVEALLNRALDMSGCTSVRLVGLYIETDETGGAHTGLMRVFGCTDVDFYSFSSEIPGTHTMDDEEYFTIDGSNAINFYGGRVYHFATLQNKAIFGIVESCRNINIDGIFWDEDTQNMTFVRVDDTTFAVGLTVTNITSNVVANCNGLDIEATMSTVRVENWIDDATACTHNIRANNATIRQSTSNYNLLAGSNHIVQQVSGTVTGLRQAGPRVAGNTLAMHTGLVNYWASATTLKATATSVIVSNGPNDVVRLDSVDRTVDITTNGVDGAPRTAKTGTFSTSTTSVTGSGTAFDTEFAVGDVLWSDTKSAGRRITAIGGATGMTIAAAFATDVSAGEAVKRGGEAPSTWYAIHMIWDGTNQRAILDTRSTPPNLPSGYTHYGFVGAVYNNSSGDLVWFGQRGDERSHRRDDASNQALANGTATSWAALSLATAVPPWATHVTFETTLSVSSGGPTSVAVWWAVEAGAASTDNNDIKYGSIAFQYPTAGTGKQHFEGNLILMVQQQLHYRVTGTDARTDLKVTKSKF